MAYTPGVESEGVASNDAIDDKPLSSAEKLILKQKLLNEATKSSPSNPLVWLELAEFQDEIDRNTEQSTRKNSTKRIQIKERKLEILQRGLKHCPRGDILVLGLLMTAEGVISDYEVFDLWNQSLKTHNESVLLLRAYIHFRLRHFPKFDISVSFTNIYM